jgi:hypothetical protein
MAIKIKPSKKGTFRKWAKKQGLAKKDGGVTDEAIQKGLKSKSKAIRKKAQFAKNAKKWRRK